MSNAESTLKALREQVERLSEFLETYDGKYEFERRSFIFNMAGRLEGILKGHDYIEEHYNGKNKL